MVEVKSYSTKMRGLPVGLEGSLSHPWRVIQELVMELLAALLVSIIVTLTL
jgi:hypothetical protein